MPRVRIALRALAVAALAIGLLAACQKPAPKITVLGGGTVVTIQPSTYCFSGTTCRTDAIDFSNKADITRHLPTLTVGIDDKLLIDVPRALSDNGWSVTAFTLDRKSAFGSSPVLHHQHTFRIAANTASGDKFVVEVTQVRKGKSDGSRWTFFVDVSAAKS